VSVNPLRLVNRSRKLALETAPAPRKAIATRRSPPCGNPRPNSRNDQRALDRQTTLYAGGVAALCAVG